MDLDILLAQKLLIALALGALIGLEREQTRREIDGGIRFAGIRTFALFGLLGAIAHIYFLEHPVLLWLLSGGVLLIIVAGYIMTSLKTKTTGSTTELAAICVYLIGFIAAQGDFFAATAITLIILTILHFKNPLHQFAYGISKEELTSTVKFMIGAFIILPLLPNTSFGPYGGFNPYTTWLMAVFISGISFVSYLAIKFFGEKRGIGLSGFLAGFVSSTALTLSFSVESKKHNHVINPFVFAIGIASSAMFFRVIVEIAVLNKALLSKILLPLVLMGITGTLLSILSWKFKNPAHKEAEKKLSTSTQELKSPFTIKPALTFAIVFAVILFLSKVSLQWFGDNGVYVTSLLSGILDVDAITVSLANMAKTNLSEEVATNAIFLAAAVNTVTKGIFFTVFGNKEVAKRLWGILGVMLVVGFLAMVIF